MPDSTTPNYGWTLPTNNADDDTWGSLLNANWSALDSQLAAVMPKAGGAFTGAVSGTTASFSGAVVAGTFSGPLTGNVTGALAGNAATASLLQTARTLSFTGDASGAMSFDGGSSPSAVLTLATVNPTPGVFGSSAAVPVVTLDGKGRVIAASTAPLAPGAPTGAVVAFVVASAPAGWLECDGSSHANADYPALGALLNPAGPSFTLPDLRGQFLRGWDHGRGLDPGRSLLSAQADQLQGHVHPLNAPNGVLPAGTTGEGFTGVTGTNTATPVMASGGPAGDGSNGTPRTGAETRPTNVAVLYCVKT